MSRQSHQLGTETTFVTRFFDYDTKRDGPVLGNLQQRVESSRLSLTLEPFAIRNNWAEVHRQTPTTDLWVVGWAPNSVRVVSPRDLVGNPAQAETHWGLFPQKERSRVALWDLHLYPAANIVELQDLAETPARTDLREEIEQIAWTATIPSLTVGRFLRELSDRSNIPAFILTVFIAIWSSEQRIIALAAIVAYPVYVMIRLWRSP